MPAGNGHANGGGNGSSHGNNNPPLPPFKFSTAPAPVAPVNSSAPRPEPAQPNLIVSLDDLAETWPEELKNEIISTSFANASVPLPMSFVDAGLKRGKVTMTWKELRTMIKPSSAVSHNDGLQLDLPLLTERAYGDTLIRVYGGDR